MITARLTADAAGQGFKPTWNGATDASILNGVQIVAVPEASTSLLGLLGIMVFLRRKR